METVLNFNKKEYYLERYPKTDDKSLRAWSNAELLVLDYIADKRVNKIHTFNDRFGVWNCTFQNESITTIWNYASQQKAIQQNLELNNFPTEIEYKTSLDNLEKVELALIKIPKSLELFELFLQQIHKSSDDRTEVVCGFMTKYFSPSYLKIAEQYFGEVEQSKAWKKARLLILKQPKPIPDYKELTNSFQWKGKEYKQYYGVFSSGNIDIGTQFFLEHLKIHQDENKVLDLASGNGVIARWVTEQDSNAKITLVDDFNLAIESSKLNLENQKTNFVCNDTLVELYDNSFDLVVSNPPFHFEHENNIEVTLSLFKDVFRILKPNGRLVLVANSHLNYSTHLNKLFDKTKVLNSNKKFEIIECKK
ncbi:hypothetical protein WH52_07910 [Tenacibaculum holothuriorum]|uniref:Uncharacterized protein n=1 Tax=Tenacibaculum holothuriorum TaxID=1635173 RepID=A0A1Y2PBX1_9FLAO|nr:methyltransferase [Tenacibaculum holothuriorum]OSY87955.1 hypothetical protein WH52_07910 [Tenacibaculum holothuriorum]